MAEVFRFTLRGTIADIDETAEDEPDHPTMALLVDAGESITRVILPPDVCEPLKQVLAIGQTVEVKGDVVGTSDRAMYLASEVWPYGATRG